MTMAVLLLLLAAVAVALRAQAASDVKIDRVGAARDVVDDATLDGLRRSAVIAYPAVHVEMRGATGADQRLARTSADGAVAAFARSHLRPELTQARQVVRLVRFTDADRGVEAPDGSVIAKYRNVLAWAVITPDAPVRVGRGMPASVASMVCDFVYVTDAATGEEIAAFQACQRDLKAR